jgi:hypothetical protein
MTENAIHKHNFEDWIPAEVKKQLIDFWGVFNRSTQDWLECVKLAEAEYCSYVSCSGFQHPPQGARVEYILENHYGLNKTEFFTGRYIHMWNNMGRLITEEGLIICVSTCDRWVRIHNKECDRAGV